jgi:hypothetical protein
MSFKNKKRLIYMMKLKINTPAIVYLSISLFILFMGIIRIPKEDIMFEILFILSITFILNILSINGLNNVAWYLVIFFLLVPFALAIISILPLFISMISKKPLNKR